MTVELRHLRYFIAVAEELHFTRAAASVGIAQPALSQQIRRLETEVGVELFHRTRRNVELSAAGAALLPFARRALEGVSGGVEAARRAARGEIGTLTVGFIESAAAVVVPTAVRRFRRDHPDVELTLRELAVEVQLEALRAGAFTLAASRPSRSCSWRETWSPGSTTRSSPSTTSRGPWRRSPRRHPASRPCSAWSRRAWESHRFRPRCEASTARTSSS